MKYCGHKYRVILSIEAPTFTNKTTSYAPIVTRYFTVIRASRHPSDCSGLFYPFLERFVAPVGGSFLWSLADEVPTFNPARFFPLGPVEHEQASHQRRPQGTHSPGDCSYLCISSKRRLQLRTDAGGDRFQDLMWQDAVS